MNTPTTSSSLQLAKTNAPSMSRSRKWLTLLLGATLTLGTGCIADEADITPLDEEEEVANDEAPVGTSPPVAIFQGFNSVSSNGLNIAVTGTTANTGASSEVRGTVVTSAAELAKAMDLDVSLSAAFGPFVSGSAKLNFVSSLNTTNYSVSVVVYAKKVTGTTTVTNAKLKTGVAAPANNTTAANTFVQKYGDSYVSSLTKGGEFIGVYVFNSQTKVEQQKVASELKAKGMYGLFKASASTQLSLDESAKSSQVSYTFHSTTTGIANPTPATPENFVDYAINFPSLPLTSPVVISYTRSGYESVPGMKNFGKVVANRSYLIGNDVSTGLVQHLIPLRGIKEQIDSISDIYSFYGVNVSDTVLATNDGIVKNDIARIKKQLAYFTSEPTRTYPNVYNAASFPSLSKGTPALNVTWNSSPNWGSNPANFDDVDRDSFVAQKTRISAIKLRAGSWVDQLEVTYANENESWTMTHGGGGGAPLNTFKFASGEYMSKLWVRAEAPQIHNFRFLTNTNLQYGGGGESAYLFTWSVPVGCRVAGFQGREGAELYRLQAWYFCVKPAKWFPINQ